MCDSSSVDDVLGELDDIEICATDWARFFDRINGASWNGRTLGSQSEMISSFCASPCGPMFDNRLKDFRDTCQAGKGKMMEEAVVKLGPEGEEEGKWVDVPDCSREIYRMLGEEAQGREGGREGGRGVCLCALLSLCCRCLFSSLPVSDGRGRTRSKDEHMLCKLYFKSIPILTYPPLPPSLPPSPPGFVGTFGCTQDMETGMLCAELIVHALSASASAQKLPPKGAFFRSPSFPPSLPPSFHTLPLRLRQRSEAASQR